MRTLALGLSVIVSALSLTQAHAQVYLPPPPPAQAAAGYEHDHADDAYYNRYTRQAWGYHGMHPIPYDQGGGFCTHQEVHQHPYPVFDINLFRDVGGYAYFIGDPMDFGYQAEAYLYAGNHPIEIGFGGGYCYMGWNHRHHFAPRRVDFVWRPGGYRYTGAFAPDYYRWRARYAGYWNGYYRTNYYGGRYFTQRPLPVYAAPLRPWIGPPGPLVVRPALPQVRVRLGW